MGNHDRPFIWFVPAIGEEPFYLVAAFRRLAPAGLVRPPAPVAFAQPRRSFPPSPLYKPNNQWHI